MVKVLIANNMGTLRLSKKVYEELGHDLPKDCGECIDLSLSMGYNCPKDAGFRSDKRLIEAVEKIGIEESKCNWGDIKEAYTDRCASNRWCEPEFVSLKIIEIPDDVNFTITDDYLGDGEFVEESHRTWS